MKTDWGTAIVGLVATLAFVAPFVTMYRKRVKKEKRMYNKLKTNAIQQNCSLSAHEFCGDFVIGIDESKEKVFFFKLIKDVEINQFVNLLEIQKCELIKKERDLKNPSSSMYSTQKVSLYFYSKDKKNPDTEFELFHEETNLQLSGELQLGEKWCSTINTLLKTKK
jgi:hypothetical protein